MTPFYSIIIPTYNSSSTISECVESVLNQTFTNFEIIIIDGLSTDKTVDIIRKYADKRIRIVSEKDNGVYDAMNKGIDYSTGEWLYFLGSDDKLFQNDLLANVKRDIDKECVDIVYGNVILSSNNQLYDGKFDRIKLSREKNICHQAIFYNKNVFKRLGRYSLEFPIYADWDFNIRCFSTPDLNIKYLELIIAYYNDQTGLSNSGCIDEYFGLYSGYITYIEEIRKKSETHRNNILNSKDYKLGKLILSPFRKILKLIR